MTGRDGTGVMGRGAKSGKGLGNCGGANSIRKGAGLGQGQGQGQGQGLGLGLGLGFRRGRPNFANPTVSITQKESLEEQKAVQERGK